MKKKTVFRIVLLVMILGIFAGYRMWDQIRTDRTAPEIHIDTQPIEISDLGVRDELLRGITATDDRDGDVTASLVVEKIRISDAHNKIAQITVSAFDRAGNVTKMQCERHCPAYIGPRYALSAPFIFPDNATINLLKFVSVEDQRDGDLTQNIRATAYSEDGFTSTGLHNVEFRVTNSLGDTAKLTLPVEVYSAGTYEADLYLSDYLIYLEKGDSFNARNYLDQFVLYSEKFSLKNGLPANFELEISGDVDTDTPGLYTVSYTVTYTRGVASVRTFSGYSKLIVVVEG